VVKQAGYSGSWYKAYNGKDISSSLSMKEYDVFLLELCFFGSATERHILEYVEKYPDMRVVCFDGHPYQSWKIARLIRVGADGYINVREGRDYVVGAPGSVPRGDSFIPADVEKVNMAPEGCFLMRVVCNGR
jgi:hypothetical protein